MHTSATKDQPSALKGSLPDPGDALGPLPYAFEEVQRNSDGGEVIRLETQNLLFEKTSPMDQLPPTPPDGSILDLGSGTGFWSVRLAARVPRGRITCLDRSVELLGLARKRLEASSSATDFLHQDLRCLELPKDAFDLVFTSMTLAHVQALEGVLPKIVASLKPGGWIACFEPTNQARSFCDLHPPCPNLALLLDGLMKAVEGRGSDLSVALKLAHHLDRLGLEETVLNNYGTALHGEDLLMCVQEVLLPLVKSFLRQEWDPGLLERSLEAALKEINQPNLWLNFRRSIVRARKPLS